MRTVFWLTWNEKQEEEKKEFETRSRWQKVYNIAIDEKTNNTKCNLLDEKRHQAKKSRNIFTKHQIGKYGKSFVVKLLRWIFMSLVGNSILTRFDYQMNDCGNMFYACIHRFLRANIARSNFYYVSSLLDFRVKSWLINSSSLFFRSLSLVALAFLAINIFVKDTICVYTT